MAHYAFVNGNAAARRNLSKELHTDFKGEHDTHLEDEVLSANTSQEATIRSGRGCDRIGSEKTGQATPAW